MLITLEMRLIALAVTVAAVIAIVLGYGHRQYTKGVTITTATYEAALAKQKVEASTTLTAETTKVLTTERALQAAKNLQENEDATHQKTVTDLADRLRRSAGVAVRLRDPNASPGCRLGSSGTASANTATPGASTGDGAETGGLFSESASGLLQRITREADEINNAYASCRAYAVKVSAKE